MNTRNIIVVDDDANFCKTLSDVLRVRGYAPTTVSTGEEALAKVREEKPAVALIDLRLGDMSGLELMQRIKDGECSPDTECIVLTGHASKESAIEAVNLGAYGYIQKPYDMEQLLLTIRRAIEKIEAAEALSESEEKFRRVFEDSGVGMAMVAPDGRLTRVNPALCQMLGYTTEELLARTMENITYPADRHKDVEQTEKMLKGKIKTFNLEKRYIHKDGHLVWGLLNKAMTHNQKGQPLFLISQIQDITGRKRLEEEVLKVQKLESIGVLAGGIAHDLNNLLTGVLGNISLARLYENPADKERRLVEAERASMQIKDLTQQLLTFSKGGTPILQTMDITALLEDSATFMLRGSNARFESSIPDDLWAVKIDEGQINQVISNLVINAKQAMPNGGVIKIRAENIDINTESDLPLEAGAYIKIFIEDEGIGISAEQIHKIFDPFYTTKQDGSGLGLATSYSIIQKHNGHISVESRIEVGTTFHIYLPASPEKTLVAEKADERKPIMGAGRVLVMDDEEMVRKLAANMLSSLGYSVTTAIDGAEAVEVYKDAMESGNSFDAVILDLTIPGGMGGKETIQKLNEIDSGVDAIVSSGYSNDPVLANFSEYGFKGVIAKPYKTEELSQVLHRTIKGAFLREGN